jgi:nucleoside-diphosphate-sugar epimerase
VHVEDVARAFVNSMEAPVMHGTYNIGSGRGLSVNEVCSAVQGALGTDIEPRRADPVSGEVRFSVADISRAREELAYHPLRDFQDSILEVANQVASR